MVNIFRTTYFSCMRNIFAIMFLLLISGNCFANDNLSQLYTNSNTNPYKTNKFLERFRLKNAGYEEKLAFDDNNDKYDLVLSRFEQEWFNKNFSRMSLNERLEHLEEFVFGTSFDESAENRLDRLKQAFNNKKRPRTTHNGLFSGVPTSIQLDIDGLTQP